MLARIRKAAEEKDSGFTLIELLVVMIIIGILAAIAIPVFLNQRKKAVDSSLKSDLRTVANEMETYFTDDQVYPPAAQASAGADVVLGTAPATVTNVKVTKGNVIKVTVAGGGYCISGYNPNASADTATKTIKYLSLSGGLQAGTALAC